MEKNLAKNIVAIILGSALYFILGNYAAITVFNSTTICFQYSILTFISVVYGPLCGSLVGLIGHSLVDLATYGRFWWSWIITSAMIGAFIGFISRKTDMEKGQLTIADMITIVIAVIISSLIGWVLVAPTLDILLYNEPTDKIFTQGLVSAICNLVTTLIICLPLLLSYAKTRAKK